MNQDLTNSEVKAKVIARINKLHAATPAQWGKMTVSQMMAHCQAQMRVAIGDEKLKQTVMGMIFGRFVKKTLLEEKLVSNTVEARVGETLSIEFLMEFLSKNLPTAPSFVIKHQPEFEAEKNKLIGLITRFTPEAITKEPHPFFGKMTFEEWSKGTWKHLDHHLKQFGV